MKKTNGFAKELSTLIGGWLSSLMILLGALNIKYEWLTEESISAFTVFIIATIVLTAFIVNVYAVYKNTYVITEEAKEQKKELEKQGLK